MIFERHANLKYKYGNRHFWCRGYYVDTVGKNAKKIQEYIQNQLKEVILSILVDTFISKISFPMQPGPEIGSISDA